MLSMGSLFDGIGVFPLAAALNGVTPVWASEIDQDAVRVTSARFPEMVHLGDIRDIDGAQIPPVDIIAGGSPCQDLSISGKRTGLAGERSGLFLEMIRVIREMREASEGQCPRFIIWENVTGALTSNKGEDFATVLSEFVGLAGQRLSVARPERWSQCGAVVADFLSILWRVLNARYWGVPQNRPRLFAVADFRPERESEQATHPDSQSVRGNPEPDSPKTGGGQSPAWPYRSVEAAEYRERPERWIGDGVPWRLLRRAAEYGDVPPVSVPVPPRTGFWADPVADLYTSTKSYYQAVYRLDNVGTLTACDYKDPPIVIAQHPGGEWGHARRLSPRECLRLQGLPQTWCDVEPRLPEKAIYRMAGNSIALPCAEFLLAALARGA